MNMRMNSRNINIHTSMISIIATTTTPNGMARNPTATGIRMSA